MMQRAIGIRGAIAANIITMVGIGPLITIPLVLSALNGPLALIAWVAGAIVALCDGLVWAELSSRFPGSGGTYVYVREIFGRERWGRLFAFLFNWQFLLFAPCLLASGYIGFANYLGYLVPAISQIPALRIGIEIAVGILTTALLYRRTKGVATICIALAVCTITTLLLVIGAAAPHIDLHRAFMLPGPVRFDMSFLAGFGSALFITLYDYVGYSDAALLGDEVRNPRRTIPLAVVISVILVAVLYIALQVGVLGVVPWQSLVALHGAAPPLEAQYVASTLVARSWGSPAAIVVTILIAATAFASVYGNLFGFSRIPYAAARDGAFLPIFAKLHPHKDIPHVALLAIGGLSLVACLFTLDQVIAFLTAGIVLIQSVLQIAGLVLVRFRERTVDAQHFHMPLYPLPAIIALVGWLLAFIYTGTTAIALGVIWLVIGGILFLALAKHRSWWPFASVLLLGIILVTSSSPVRASTQSWKTWHTSTIIQENGYPVFTVDKKPFFVYGAAFFYERIPKDLWARSLATYRNMGINTIDLYLIWNWHELSDGNFDFTGRTNPRRDLHTLFALIHKFGFKVIVRPGPVIRNEWRNGGYPAWLLKRPEYNMPLHDILEGRYPATATLQNAHADAAAAEWLHNPTHLHYSARWLSRVLHEIEPWSHDIIAVALDDDQGAYIDNDTWPAPHWHRYIDWLGSTVQKTIGKNVPLFINTYQMEVTASSPVWAWGDWYQSDALLIGDHDRNQIDFSTQLLGTQPHVPIMLAEFQAGWLQGAGEVRPRPADPTNTSLAFAYLLQNGVHGIVNFPLQDTWFPDGWEAPWANRFYSWDAALSPTLRKQPRYYPTYAFGQLIARWGTFIAHSHPLIDADIAWLPSTAPTPIDISKLAAATIVTLERCRAIGYTCKLVDLRFGKRDPSVPLLFPQWPGFDAEDPAQLSLPRHPGTVTLLADSGNGRLTIRVANRAPEIIPVAVTPEPLLKHVIAETNYIMKTGQSPSMNHIFLQNPSMVVEIAPDAGARVVRIFDRTSKLEAATSIGAFRDDATTPPTPSPRDYIAAYTHPLEAGTFNRRYECHRETSLSVTCSYDAPDLGLAPVRFKKTFALDTNAPRLIVTLSSSDDAASISAINDDVTISILNPSPQTSITVQTHQGYQLVRVAYPTGKPTTLILKFK